MKKLLLCLMLLCALFTGCTSDEDYIETVKNIPIQNILESNTTEELAVNFIRKTTNLQNVNTSNLKWSIEGETSKGKMVIAQYNQNKVYFDTIKNGDYIEYMPIEVYIITNEKKKITLAEIMYNDIVDDFSEAFDF